MVRRNPAQSRLSFSQREKILRRNERQWQLYDRKRRLYNRKYRKSLFFISIWIARAIFLLLMGFVFFFDGGHGSTRKEVILSGETGVYMTLRERGKTLNVYQLRFKTNKGDYEARFAWESPPAAHVGDTIVIERNLLNKPAFFSFKEGAQKYPLAINWVGYLLVLILVAISLFFNDGLDRSTDVVLLLTWTSILGALFCYLVG